MSATTILGPDPHCKICNGRGEDAPGEYLCPCAVETLRDRIARLIAASESIGRQITAAFERAADVDASKQKERG